MCSSRHLIVLYVLPAIVLCQVTPASVAQSSHACFPGDANADSQLDISDPIYFDKSLKFTIEHGHNNCLTLDLASVAYWYQSPPLTKLPAIADKESRKPKRFIQPADIHKWRHEWRKSHDSESQLWGNER